MEQIRQSAWQLLLSYGNTKPLQLDDLLQICDDHGWEIRPYSKAAKFIQAFPDLADKVKTCTGTAYISDEITVILYKDNLSSIERKVTIAHEIGHICLKHASCGSKGMSRFTDAQEREADVFAYELLLPSIVIQKSGIRTPYQLKKLGLLNEDGINYAISAVQDRLDEIPGALESQVLQRFSGFIRETRIRFSKDTYQKHLTKRLRVIPLLLIVVFVAYLFYQQKTALPATVSNEPPAIAVPVEGKQTELVYITRSGSKYHKDGCHYLSDTAFAITIEEAEQAGLEPCKVCKPKLE